MNNEFWDVNLPMTMLEAKWILNALDEYTDNNYNEIVSIVQSRLQDLLDEQEER